MAVFTETERSAIRKWLGYPARFWDIYPQLQLALNAMDAATEEDRTTVRAVLTALDAIDTSLTDAHNRLKASVVGSIVLNSGEIGALRSEGRRHVGRLAALLSCPVLRDPFSGGLAHDNRFDTE
jgi:hypothetical protein